ncbi:hypothetical protein AGR1B_pAt30237 [Agrobacterium fabacearum S56]|nr:hypothetical protein AGR1B_pAt30237 [Agrobacterium fabacearum S56]
MTATVPVTTKSPQWAESCYGWIAPTPDIATKFISLCLTGLQTFAFDGSMRFNDSRY